MFDILGDTIIDKDVITFLVLSIAISVLALFHTVFLSSLKKQIKPKWFLFGIYNVVGGILFFINPIFTIGWIIFLFISLIIIFLITALSNLGSNLVKEIKELSVKPEPVYKKIISVLVILLFICLFFTSGPFFFLGVFVFIILSNIWGGNKNRYLKLQAVLPTSKIRSMAMGLVEVEGRVKVMDTLIAPANSKECIGYLYTIESISTDSDGDNHYKTIHTEKKCNSFFLEDDTGCVEVNPEKLEFILFPVDKQYSAASRRYTQYVLYEGDEILLIGKADTINGVPVITHESIKNVFGMSPVFRINRWNRFKPLRSKMLLYLMVFGFLAGMIMILSINEAEGTIIIRFPENIFSWKF